MPYNIKNYKGSTVANVLEGTVNTQTSLNLIGQNYKNYGQLIAENFVHILENFSRDTAPTNPMVGQLWFKPTDGYLYMLDADNSGNQKWKQLANITVATTDPTTDSSGYTPREGDFWFDSSSDNGILNIRYKDESGVLQWGQLSVPVSADATFLFQSINSHVTDGSTPPTAYPCIKVVLNKKIVGIFNFANTQLPWEPLKADATVTIGSTATVYKQEKHPDGLPIYKEFPKITTGLTLAGEFDPDVTTSSGDTVAGYRYDLKFSAPDETDGTQAEGYAIIDRTDTNQLGKITGAVMTNKGSGYTGSPTVIIGPPQDTNGVAATANVTKGSDGTADEDKITGISMTASNGYTGGKGYSSPPVRPSLNGSVRIGINPSDQLDLTGCRSGFGNSIQSVKIISGGSNYDSNSDITFAAPSSGVTAVGSLTVTGGVITGVTITTSGSGYTYALSTEVGEGGGITLGGNGSGAKLVAELGDNRILLDRDAISGDKLHGGTYSAFQSNAITDLTNPFQNDPGIDGLTLNDGQTTVSSGYGGTALGGDDNSLSAYTGATEYNSTSGGSLTTTATSTAAVKRLAGYVEVAFERDQTIGNSSAGKEANGALRIKGGAHIEKNLQVNGNVHVAGNHTVSGSSLVIESNNLLIEDNLFQLNSSQHQTGDSTNNAFDGVSGFWVNRGKSSGNLVNPSALLWDDTDGAGIGQDSTSETGGDDFDDGNYFKVVTFSNGSLTESGGTAEDKPTITADAITRSGVSLANFDAKIVMAKEGVKADVVSDHRDHSSSSLAGRSNGGKLTTYNGFAQDVDSASYPYNAEKDFILVDQDERIIRGEFHFYRDAIPVDGKDSLVLTTNSSSSTGGIATSKVSQTVAKSWGTGSTFAYIKGSAGPYRHNYNTSPTSLNAWTGGTNNDTGFLDEPVYIVGSNAGVVTALPEGRSIGWKNPRLLIQDDAGTGAFVGLTVSATGGISGGTLYTKGKYYSATTLNTAVVGEARDTTTASGTDYIAAGGKQGVTGVNLSNQYGHYLDSAIPSPGDPGIGYRSAKPFKEINAIKFNGAFCAYPGHIPAGTKLEHTPGETRSNAPGSTSITLNDSDNKYVGVYPVMDGHNDYDITSESFPYKGGGMTLGTQHLHFIDTYTRNVRVENPNASLEELSIINRNTFANSNAAKAKINIVATNSNAKGTGDILVRAQGGTDTTSDGPGNVVIESRANGATSDVTVQAISGSTAAGTTADGGHTNVFVKSVGGTPSTGVTGTYPYGQRKDVGNANVGSNVSAKDGSEVHIQATNMVVIEAPHATGRSEATGTGSVQRLEVDATDTFINGHIHLGNVVANTSSDHTFSHNVYFNADVGSHVFPNEDASGATATSTMNTGYDLGATAYKNGVGELTANLTTDTGDTTDRRWRTIYVRNISAGSASDTGTVTGDWSLTAGSTFQATYTADMAERYEADEELTPGTVVAMGGDKEITATTEDNDENVFGVISTEPGFVLNGGAGEKGSRDKTHPKVAMVGRCPCKVIGRINKGDRLVSSSTKGVARKADLTNDSAYAIIGRAIEAHDSDGEGTIEIAVARN